MNVYYVYDQGRLHHIVISGVVTGEAAPHPPKKLGAVGKLSDIFLLVGKSPSKNANICNIMGRLEILSTHNLLCRKFAAFCRKMQVPVPPTFLPLHALAM